MDSPKVMWVKVNSKLVHYQWWLKERKILNRSKTVFLTACPEVDLMS